MKLLSWLNEHFNLLRTIENPKEIQVEKINEFRRELSYRNCKIILWGYGEIKDDSRMRISFSCGWEAGDVKFYTSGVNPENIEAQLSVFLNEAKKKIDFDCEKSNLIMENQNKINNFFTDK